MRRTASVSALGRVPKHIARKLGYYVYLLVNPLNNDIFYVGKGKGNRALAHLKDTADVEKRKDKIIRQIRAQKEEPRIEILAQGLKNAETAKRIEAAAIDLLGVSKLTNEIRGLRSSKLPRMSLRDVIATYEKRRIKIDEPAILIRINRLYHYGMTDAQLYDATRGIWKVGSRREKAEYAFAVYEGIVREVYAIKRPWLPAGSTYFARRPNGYLSRDRWEFVGTVAEDRIRNKYRGKYVGHYFKQGAQNPIAYVNI